VPVTVTPTGGHIVTINTTTLSITGDDADPVRFYGTPFMASIVDGKAQFLILGNLIIPGDTINVIGSRPLSLVVANDVVISPNAVFNLSAVGTMAGAGGGASGTSGVGGSGGFAGSGGTGGAGGAGGPGETAFGGAVSLGAPAAPAAAVRAEAMRSWRFWNGGYGGI
jgi:hypothetical protein